MKFSFVDSDAVLLQAILSGCGSSSIALSSLLQMISIFGHGPLTFDQLDGGLARLIQAGLIALENQKITPSAMLLRDSEILMSDEGDAETSLQNLLSYLESLSSGSDDPASGDHTWKTGILTPKDYDAGFC